MIQEQDAQILFVGAKLPRNYGPFFNRPFERIFSEIAKEYDLVFMPFLLKDVGLEKGYMLPDGLHPNDKAQPVILDNLWPYLEQLL